MPTNMSTTVEIHKNRTLDLVKLTWCIGLLQASFLSLSVDGVVVACGQILASFTLENRFRTGKNNSQINQFQLSCKKYCAKKFKTQIRPVHVLKFIQIISLISNFQMCKNKISSILSKFIEKIVTKREKKNLDFYILKIFERILENLNNF